MAQAEHQKANSSNPVLLESSTGEYHCSRLLDEAFLIAYLVLGVAIFVGNTFCCAVFLASPKLRRCYMNIFLVSHGFADIFVATLVIPGHCMFCTSCSKDFIFQRILDEGACRFLDAVKDYVWLASVFSLLGITYDRYSAVFQPLLYQCKMTSRTVVVCLLIIFKHQCIYSGICLAMEFLQQALQWKPGEIFHKILKTVKYGQREGEEINAVGEILLVLPCNGWTIKLCQC